MVRKKRVDPMSQSSGIVDFGNESISDENEEDEDDKQPPPPPPQVSMTHDERPSSSSIHD